MPQTTASVNVSQAQYEALAGGPPVLPTQRELFDYEIAALREAGFNAEEMLPLAEFIPEHCLFLLVPRRSDPMNYGDLMAKVMIEGRTGVTYLDQRYLMDEVETPKGPYLMVDIEDGRARLNVKPTVSRTNIANDKRSPYVTYEGIVHAATFPSVLLHHYLDLCGSRCNRRRVPSVYVCVKGPALSSGFEADAVPEWGAPSCGKRIGLRP